MGITIKWFILARAIHISAVVIWIGGVFFVTFVLLPALKQLPVTQRLSIFERLEHRFGWFARLAVIATGISGLLLVKMIGFWQRWYEWHLWPIHLMLLVWCLFALMLFFLEPFWLHKAFHRFAIESPEIAVKIITWAHWFLSVLSFTAVIAGVMLAHGWDF